MKGKLYLGRISDFNDFSERNIKCYAITRSDKFHSYMGVFNGLAPSWDLLRWHNLNKNRINFNDGYYEKYFNQVKTSSEAQEDIKSIINSLNNGEDLALICFCATHDRCHRGIIGTWFKKKGYEVVYK